MAFFRTALSSLRLRYALLTFTLLAFVIVFCYFSGKFILGRLVGESKAYISGIGEKIESQVRRLAEDAGNSAAQTVACAGCDRIPLSLFVRNERNKFSLLIRLDDRGVFQFGLVQQSDGLQIPLVAADVRQYEGMLQVWLEEVRRRSAVGEAISVGLLRVSGMLHGTALVPCRDGAVLLGMPFNVNAFVECLDFQLKDERVRVVEHIPDVDHLRRHVPPAELRSEWGIVPIFRNAALIRSQGFGDQVANSFDAVFTVRDIAGNDVVLVSVSLPRTIAGIAQVAVQRLVLLALACGLLFGLPVFWLQSRMLIRPLVRMNQQLAAIREEEIGRDCPQISWPGRDEFAALAAAANRMLALISRRTIAIAQLEQRQRALIEGVPDALYVFDRYGRFVTQAKKAVGGKDVPGLEPGKALSAEVYGRLSAEMFVDRVAAVSRDGRVQSMCVAVSAGDAPETLPRHFDLRLSKMDDMFVLVLVRDVTDEIVEHRLRLAAEAREAENRRRESMTLMAAGIAHDMNNILSVVLSAGEIIGSKPDADGQTVYQLSAIREAVRRGAGMMRELRSFAGENRIVLTRLDPVRIMDDVRMLLGGVVGQNIDISFDVSRDVPCVDVDQNQFWKVLFNIVKNAGEAIGAQSGQIKVSLAGVRMTEDEAASYLSEIPLEPGAGVRFTVQDNGPGIPDDLSVRLFDPFVSSKSAGRGLGLATVRTIIDAHGGGVRVRSEQGRGTSFDIYLPASVRPTAEPSAAPADAASGPVLVIDDDPAILKTTSILLKMMKRTPYTATSLRDALGVCRRVEDLSVILLDASLCTTDAVRLIWTLRAAAPGTPVVVASGRTEAQVRALFADVHYDAYLSKPYTLNELKEALSSVVRV